MSQTIRRLPVSGSHGGKNHGKWYAACRPYAKPDYASIKIRHYRVGLWHSSIFNILLENEIDISFYEVERYENGHFQVILKTAFSTKDTHEKADKAFEEEIIEFARKNGTCKRQRKNGVRITKQIDRRQRRACLKMALIKELTMVEQEVPDVSKRRTISEKRKFETLAHQTKWRQRKLQDALEKSTAKTFDDLYVENQWYYGED